MRWRVLGSLTRKRPPPTVETLYVLAFALIGLRLGLRPIGDNSTLVHLRTGMDMITGWPAGYGGQFLDGSVDPSGPGGIPRTDPYSFTAGGEPWVVQSWLVSYVYGFLYHFSRLLGILPEDFAAIVVLNGILYGALAAIIATLARTGNARRTCGAAAVAIGLGVATWSPRPLAVGLVAFALTVLVVERNAPPWWLLPIGWIWVNSHGSFVLGAVWLVLLAVSGRRDAAKRYLPWCLAGIVAGGILNPLGPKLLAFPLTLLTKASNFERVIEWRAPTFRGPFGAITLAALVAALVILARARTRPVPWFDIVPAAVFITLALVSQRNLAPAGIVLAPVLGRALRANQAATAADEDEPARPRAHTVIAAVMTAAAVLSGVAAFADDPLDFDGYPNLAGFYVPAGRHIVSTDIGASQLIFQRGREAGVFIDDRYDLYPTRVVDDYLTLYDGRPGALEILDRYDVDVVLWPAEKPLATILAAQPRSEWRRAYLRDDWVVFVREDYEPGFAADEVPASERRPSS